MIKYKIREEYDNLSSYLFELPDYFTGEYETIHKARNELKVIDFEGTTTVVKAFKIPNLLNRFVYAYLRDSKAKKSFNNAVRLTELDITTPEPIGYIEFHRFGLLERSYFVSRLSKYDFTIREVLLNADWPDHDLIFREFGKFTYDIHQKGVLHLDYSPGNILISKTDEGYRFDLVDINRMRFGPLTTEEGLQNFNKLWANENDLRVMGEAYAECAGLDPETTVAKMIAYDRKHKKIKEFKRSLKGKK